jgi:hypothetical protein
MNTRSESVIVILAMSLVLLMNTVVLFIVIDGNKQRMAASARAAKERSETKCILLIPQSQRVDADGSFSERVKACGE